MQPLAACHEEAALKRIPLRIFWNLNIVANIMPQRQILKSFKIYH